MYFRTYVTDEGNLACHLGGREFYDVDTVPKNTWEYYAVSIRMNSDAVTSSVRFIMGKSNTQSTTTATVEGEKFVDVAHGGNSYIGSTRSDSFTHGHFMKGYIFNFHVDNGFYQQFTDLHYGAELVDCSCDVNETCVETISNCDDFGNCEAGSACLVDVTEGGPGPGLTMLNEIVETETITEVLN